MLGCGFYEQKPLPTYTPAPIQQIVVTPTPIPESEWICLKGKVEINAYVGPYGENSSSIIGDQILCGRDWKISGVFGPAGYLDSHPEQVITFGDLIGWQQPNSDTKTD